MNAISILDSVKLNIWLHTSHPDHEKIQIVWLRAKKLDELWRINEAYYIHEYTGAPKDTWFLPKSNGECLIIPEIYLDRTEPHGLMFVNGRHRARWLIQEGCEEIPVGMHESQIQLASELGLFQRYVVTGDQIILE